MLRSHALQWQGHGEGAPSTRSRLKADGALMSSGDAAGDPQAQPQPTEVTRRNRAFETFEDAPLVIIRNADSMVDDAQPGRLALTGQLDLDGFATAVLDGIVEQVGNHSAQTRAVPGA